MTDTKTPYGVIHYGGACRDDYGNLVIYDQPPKGGSPVKLQAPAMRAFKAAERRYARACGWSEARIKREGGRPIPLSGSWRSCAYQRELYESDRNRYASPDGTMHTRGLAVDVSTGAPNQDKIRRALKNEGWHQARSDEPWHYSFSVSA
jgi:hypothetical protein